MRLNYGLNKLNMLPTHTTTISATLIDHVYFSCGVTYAGTCNLHVTDHYAVVCCFNSIYSSKTPSRYLSSLIQKL